MNLTNSEVKIVTEVDCRACAGEGEFVRVNPMRECETCEGSGKHWVFDPPYAHKHPVIVQR